MKEDKPIICEVKDLPQNDSKKFKKFEEFKKTNKMKEEKKLILSNEQWNHLIKELNALYDPQYNTDNVRGYDFVCTCHACPEQYDVYRGSYKNGERVAYVRKRWGHLSAYLVQNGRVTDYLLYEESGHNEWDGTIEDKDRVFNIIVNKLNNLPY